MDERRSAIHKARRSAGADPLRELLVAPTLFGPIGQVVANLPAALPIRMRLALGRRRSS